MNELKVTSVENGFVVNEYSNHQMNEMGTQWVFETPDALSRFMLGWGVDNRNIVTKGKKSRGNGTGRPSQIAPAP